MDAWGLLLDRRLLDAAIEQARGHDDKGLFGVATRLFCGHAVCSGVACHVAA